MISRLWWAVAAATGVLLLVAGARRVDPSPEGLNAAYFDNAGWAGPAVLSTIDPLPSTERFAADWRRVPDVFTVSWQGTLFVPTGGDYTFATASDDGSWVYLDGTLVVDNGGAHSERLERATTPLAGGVHNLLIRYAQNGGSVHFEFLWATGSRELELFPAWALSPRRITARRFVARQVLDTVWQIASRAWVLTILLAMVFVVSPALRRTAAAAADATAGRTKPATRYPWFATLAALGVGSALAHGLVTLYLPRLEELGAYLVLAGATAAVIAVSWWTTRRDPDEAFESALPLFLIALAAAYLVNIWVQVTWKSGRDLLFGNLLDGDMQLYFCYGRQLLGWPASAPSGCPSLPFGDGRYPTMEYPQGALALFAGSVLLAGDRASTFRWVFPLVTVGLMVATAALLLSLGRSYGGRRTAIYLTTAGLLAPYLFRLAPVRYDIAPTFFLLLGAFVFAGDSEEAVPGSHASEPVVAALTSAALTGGVLMKWLPGLMLPFVVGYYVQRRAWRAAGTAIVVSGLILAIVFVPFFLWDAERFLNPYRFHSSRTLIGESVWFLVQDAFFDPRHVVPSRPWTPPYVVYISNGATTIVQVALTFLPLALAFLRRRTRAQWAALGLCSVAIFTLANRIFSPQFIIALDFTWAAALVLIRARPRAVLVASLALVIVGLTNFLVFPLRLPGWEWYSAVMFTTAGLLTAWIVWRALARPGPV